MLRRTVAPALVVAALVSAVAAPAGARTGSPNSTTRAMRALESQVLADMNRVRAAHGLASLRLSPKLAAASAQHSREMGQRGYFSHSSANGEAFWRRVQRYYGAAHHRYWAVGENLLWQSPDIDGASAVELWMRSPEHRANLLNRQWREVGLAAVHVAAAPGTYRGLDVTIVTADFGVRR